MRGGTRKEVLRQVRLVWKRGSCLTARSDQQRRWLMELCGEGLLAMPDRDCFAEKVEWDKLDPAQRAEVRMRTICSSRPSCVFCGISAAHMLGLPIPYRALSRLHYCIPGDDHSRQLICGVQHTMGKVDSVIVRGVRTTTLEQTVTDCLCHLDFASGLAVADSYLRITGETTSQLLARLEKYSRHRGIKQARFVAQFADPRSESWGESIARATFIELGYQIPDLQVEIPNLVEWGRVYRVDYLWKLPRGKLVAGEFDGKEKYEAPEMTQGRTALEVMSDERVRESRISAAGVTVMRMNFRDVLDLEKMDRVLSLYGVPRSSVDYGDRFDYRPRTADRRDDLR